MNTRKSTTRNTTKLKQSTVKSKMINQSAIDKHLNKSNSITSPSRCSGRSRKLNSRYDSPDIKLIAYKKTPRSQVQVSSKTPTKSIILSDMKMKMKIKIHQNGTKLNGKQNGIEIKSKNLRVLRNEKKKDTQEDRKKTQTPIKTATRKGKTINAIKPSTRTQIKSKPSNQVRVSKSPSRPSRPSTVSTVSTVSKPSKPSKPSRPSRPSAASKPSLSSVRIAKVPIHLHSREQNATEVREIQDESLISNIKRNYNKIKNIDIETPSRQSERSRKPNPRYLNSDKDEMVEKKIDKVKGKASPNKVSKDQDKQVSENDRKSSEETKACKINKLAKLSQKEKVQAEPWILRLISFYQTHCNE